jgi:hypothetical protein
MLKAKIKVLAINNINDILETVFLNVSLSPFNNKKEGINQLTLVERSSISVFKKISCVSLIFVSDFMAKQVSAFPVCRQPSLEYN